jgi:2-keto-3-deoxy-L-rhamnonate aldolase RhmA
LSNRRDIATGGGAIPNRRVRLATAQSRWGIRRRVRRTDRNYCTDRGPEALNNIEAILAVKGIDGLFIGQDDLAAALGAASSGAPQIRAVVQLVSKAAADASKAVAVFVSTAAEAARLKELGATTFVVGSDQSFIRRSAALETWGTARDYPIVLVGRPIKVSRPHRPIPLERTR